MLKQPCFPSISPSKGKLNSVSQSETRDPEQSCNEDSPKILEEPSVKCLLLVVKLSQLSTTLGLDPVSSSPPKLRSHVNWPVSTPKVAPKTPLPLYNDPEIVAFFCKPTVVSAQLIIDLK